ncbi:nucleotidyltransferase [Parafilimonas sp.]|uniref:nucleotidyltransferase n=1 Tax=Parafilimonas sp. TaxID=1969739 RepID=UPI0039E3737E
MKKLINLEKDFLDFISLCNHYNVKYLVIGGYAVGAHGYPRLTKDLDISIQISEGNAEKIIQVINDFGLGSLKLTKEDFMKVNFITQLGYEPVRIDILNDLAAVSFDDAWKNRKVINMVNIPVNFIGLDELLIVKEKAGRKQDIADVDKLKKRNKKNK